jgi:hypothetical protein
LRHFRANRIGKARELVFIALCVRRVEELAAENPGELLFIQVVLIQQEKDALDGAAGIRLVNLHLLMRPGFPESLDQRRYFTGIALTTGSG